MPWLKRNALDIAAFIWGVAEATVFFIVPDVLLSYIGLKRGARATMRSAVIAALGAALGGIVMYLWSASDFAAAETAVAHVPAISTEMMARAQQAMGEHWFYATLLGPLTSTPFKVFAIYAPGAGVPLWAFAAASVFARLPRFLIVGFASAGIAAWLRRRFSERVILVILAAAWIAFYVVFFTVMTA